MAVTGTIFEISYATDGVTYSFAYPDYLFQKSDLQAYYTPSGGATVQLVINRDYSLVGAADTFGAYPSGVTLQSLTLGTLPAPLTPGVLLMTRRTQETQQIQYIDGDKFPAMKHEHALDKLTLMVQEINAQFRGAVTGPPSGPGTTYNVGDWFQIIPPVPGGPWGIVCTTAGAPGVWNYFGNISLL